jgi:hypothetical protein
MKIVTEIAPDADGLSLISQGRIFYDKDGDGTNDTVVVTDDPDTGGPADGTSVAPQTAVPVLSPAGLVIFILGLMAAAFYARRRQQNQNG